MMLQKYILNLDIELVKLTQCSSSKTQYSCQPHNQLLAVKMICKCKILDVRVSGYREDNYFKEFPELKTVDNGWRAILRCPECGQHWLVDIFDRVQYLYAYKVDSAEPMSEGEFYKIHKKQLEESRNGYSKETCVIAGCNNKALNDLAYCANCAIKKFGIYE